MAVKPSEYKSESVKEIILSSGETWKIRRLPFENLAEFFTALGIKIGQDKQTRAQIEETFRASLDQPDFKDKLVNLTKIVLPACSVEPKIQLDGDSSDDYILYSEVKPMHVFELFFEMLEFSELSETATESRKKFQRKLNR